MIELNVKSEWHLQYPMCFVVLSYHEEISINLPIVHKTILTTYIYQYKLLHDCVIYAALLTFTSDSIAQYM